MRRLVVIAVALAVGFGAALAAGAATARPAASTLTRHHVVVRGQVARCVRRARADAKDGRGAKTAGPARHAHRSARVRKRACRPAKREPLRTPPVSVAVPTPRPEATAPPPPTPPAAPAAPIVATDPAPVATTPTVTTPAPPVASTLGVGAFDIGGFLLRFTKASVPAGDLTIFYRNNDVSDHNLWIEGPGDVLERISDTVGENGGASKTLAVTPGAWRLFCSLPGHEAMSGTLTVTP